MQIMTDHEGNRKIYLAQGIQEGLETVDYCQQLTMSCDGKGRPVYTIGFSYRFVL